MKKPPASVTAPSHSPVTSAGHRGEPAEGRREERSLANFRRILAPIDFSEVSFSALPYAVTLSACFGATIYLLYVVDRPPAQRTEDAPRAGPEEQEALRSGERLVALAAQRISRRLPVITQVRAGRPFDVITRFAREMQIDLIVVARSGFAASGDSLLCDDITDLVTRYAPCPVLAVHQTERELI
jgi:nucleotide-binding universal stress UspA family protein